MSRINILISLLTCTEPLDKIELALKDYKWDSEELVVLEKKHIRNVLSKYFNHEISDESVKKWANVIECRDDISFKKDNEEELKEIIFKLANPEIEGALTMSVGKEIYLKLEN